MTNTPRVLVSNIMMLKNRDRFEREIRALGAEPVFADVEQYLNEEACLAYAGDFDVWSSGDDRITRKVMEAFLPRLRGIAKWGTGIDSIDLTAAKVLDLPVLNSPGAFSEAVAEVGIGYMLMLSRHLGMIDRAVRCGQWPKPMGGGLWGKTLGMIGFGAIGRGIALRAASCGMNILAYDPPMAHLTDMGVNFVSLEELLRQADVTCLACNLTSDNRHMINAETLKLMKPTAYLVNVARGQLVDEAALVAALTAGRIAGAGLDVFEEEPLPMTSQLMTMENVVLGSHNANNLESAVEYVHANTMKNIMKLLSVAK